MKLKTNCCSACDSKTSIVALTYKTKTFYLCLICLGTVVQKFFDNANEECVKFFETELNKSGSKNG